MKSIHRNDSIHTPRTRDAALRRLDRTSRWLLAGSAVLTGVLTDVAANAFPGHAKSKASAATGKSSQAKHKPLAPPAEAPKATTTSEQAAPPAEETAETPAAETPAETSAPEQAAPTQETAPESAPAEETTPEQREALPPPEEPVVSGGS